MPSVQIGTGGIGQMTISNGGSVAVQGTGQRNFIVGNSTTGSGTLNMTTGAQLNASWFAVGNNGGAGVATINNSTVNLDGTDFFNGDPIGAGVRVGRGDGANGVLNLENGAVINLNNTIANSSVDPGRYQLRSKAGPERSTCPARRRSTSPGPPPARTCRSAGLSGIGLMTMTGDSTVNVGATGTHHRRQQLAKAPASCRSAAARR